MNKNNKHLYWLSGLSFIVAALIIVWLNTNPEVAVWLNIFLWPLIGFFFVMSLIFLGMAFIRKHKIISGIPEKKAVNPMVSIVLGLIIILSLKFALSGIDFVLILPLYLLGGGIFFVGFFGLLKDIKSGKLER